MNNNDNTPIDNDRITISRKEYDELVENSDFLAALRAVGVDNWEGYGEAYKLLNSEN